MLSRITKRGFSEERLEKVPEPKIKRDEKGHYIVSISEGVKVYLEDYYSFLEEVWERAVPIYQETQKRLDETPDDHLEAKAFYRARKIIMEVVLTTVKRFYATEDSLGMFMSPWCFGTVVLEKVEMVRDKISKGEETKHEVGEYPYYVTRYIEEIHRKALLDLFEFSSEAFSMRWQYSELLKRYSKTLTNITSSLQSVLLMVRSYTS
ncbi:MAG: hypothetical protein GF404_04635 [candidate division Zixibacteria bacterium]|jgi:hypothetical protein|nr:hypothetical protein [candidate division Zixibacteria bacterium]